MSTGGESAESAIDFSVHAQDVGVDALLLMHPSALAMNDDEMVEYFSRVIRAVEIPVLIHHAKSMAKQPLSIDAQVRLFEEFGPDRVMFKPEASPTPPRLSQLRDATGGQARIFEGDGGMMLLDCHRRGLVGDDPRDRDRRDRRGAVEPARGRRARAGRADRPPPLLPHVPHDELDRLLLRAWQAPASSAAGSSRRPTSADPVRFHLDIETREEVERIYDGLLDAARAANLLNSARTH